MGSLRVTAAPHSTLVEQVATAIATRRAQSRLPRRLFHIDYAAPTAEDTRDAQAALAACHAEEMLGTLRLLMDAKHEKDRYGKTPHYEALKAEGWKAAEDLLAKLGEAV